VPAEDPCTDVLETTRGEALVDARGPCVPAEQRPLDGAGREEPLMELRAAHAQRIVTVLTRTRAVPLERDGKTVDAYLAHCGSPFSFEKTMRLLSSWGGALTREPVEISIRRRTRPHRIDTPVSFSAAEAPRPHKSGGLSASYRRPSRLGGPRPLRPPCEALDLSNMH